MNYKYCLVLILLGILGLEACQKPTEGCMHPRSSNFNAEADKEVGCTYYQLQLSFLHALDNIGTPYTFSMPHLDSNNDSFKIEDFRLLLTNIHLQKSDGTEAHIIDKITIPLLSGEELSISDNFYIAQNAGNGANTTDIGGWVTLDTFATLNFTVGLADSRISDIDYALMRPLTHPLADTSESVYDNSNQQYYAGWANLTAVNYVDTLVVGWADTMNISLPYPVIALDAATIPVGIQLTYENLFDGVSFANDDQSTIITKLKNNLRNAFTSY
ncbi:MAG: hypothetical protein GY810_11475 [Aureispira sp.]|nr:hypothetical protein [Aureispira sp.]